jgi:transcriptional regulator with XRE-family HTH domain
MIYEDFTAPGTIIKDFADSRNITQKELANRLGMSEKHISNLLNGKVRVFNYELSPAGFPSQHNQNGVLIRGRDEDEEFVVERVSFDDIESENTKSDLFKVGRLRFAPEEEDEIYKKLGIEDRDNIKTDSELIELLKRFH